MTTSNWCTGPAHLEWRAQYCRQQDTNFHTIRQRRPACLHLCFQPWGGVAQYAPVVRAVLIVAIAGRAVPHGIPRHIEDKVTPSYLPSLAHFPVHEPGYGEALAFPALAARPQQAGRQTSEPRGHLCCRVSSKPKWYTKDSTARPLTCFIASPIFSVNLTATSHGRCSRC